jgi:cell division septal protein FtsQ
MNENNYFHAIALCVLILISVFILIDIHAMFKLQVKNLEIQGDQHRTLESIYSKADYWLTEGVDCVEVR